MENDIIRDDINHALNDLAERAAHVASQIDTIVDPRRSGHKLNPGEYAVFCRIAMAARELARLAGDAPKQV